jgi:hypothetical protein
MPTRTTQVFKARAFEQLLEIRDWYEATHPRLSKFTMTQAAEAADDWHTGLHGGIPLPRGSVRRGELFLVHPSSDVDSPDGFWSIQRLTTRHQYEDEGRALRHCVGGGGYWRAHQAGETEIFSVRNEDGDPVLTIEVSVAKLPGDGEGGLIPLSVDQVKGMDNETPLSIIAHGATDAGHSKDMALEGAQALVDKLKNLAAEQDHTLVLHSEARMLRLAGFDCDLAEEIAEGDFEIDQGAALALNEILQSSHNAKLAEAWATAVEEGHADYTATGIIWDQLALQSKRMPPGMDNLDDWCNRKHGRYLNRTGEGDNCSPHMLFFEETIRSPDATASLTIKGVCWIDFSHENDWDVNGEWYLLTDSELRYRDAGVFFETPDWDDFDGHHDPEGLLDHMSYDRESTSGSVKRICYTHWKPELLRCFAESCTGHPSVKLGDIVEQMDDWVRDDALHEALAKLQPSQRERVVLGPFRGVLSAEWTRAADMHLLAGGKPREEQGAQAEGRFQRPGHG